MTFIAYSKSIMRTLMAYGAVLLVSLRWRLRHIGPKAKPHGLESPLVVSLTSYPPRFRTLLPTLKSLLLQSVAADHVELWIAQADYGRLPRAVLALQSSGLAIRTCADLRSYKKIIPALAAHPDAVIVTADDDAYYWKGWLEGLTSAYRPERNEVLCHRAHEIVLEGDRPASYPTWRFETASTEPSRMIFPTGLGGVLYRPGILMADFARQDLFGKYCPTADDVWLFWMASLKGALFRKVGPVRRFILWPEARSTALYNHNVVGANANDVQIAAMIEAYGFPVGREKI